MLVVDHTGVAAQGFPGTADRCEAHQRVLVFFGEEILGFPDRLAPDIGRIANLGPVILDMQVNGLVRLALDDQQVVAGELEFAAELAARVRAGDRAGQRALGDDRVAAAGRRHGAGQRTGGEYQLVFRG